MGAIAVRMLRASIRMVLPLAALAGSAAFAAQPAETDVDLELVLAVDISYSMDTEEQQVQREGYGAAIVSKPVLDAIRDGLLGRIAVTYVEWAGSEEQATIVPWRIIDGPESAQAFAAALAAQPLRRAYRTSISGALAYSARAFEASGVRGLRQVIDVSGDGPNNQGEMVERVRDEVLERGVVINGLPLMLKRPSSAMMDLGDLDAYYRDCVIGGPGAFVLPVRSVDQFPDAVRTKLVMEIAGLPPAAPAEPETLTAVPAAGVAQGPSSCTVGEQLWRDRFGN
ncbi:DUF1194 domain-containing protein [Methylopila sp. Yamaguchi]|uniref:DUF1194 domain-containing protein n=1 Tax=Methylopila sp. Yamaguchi TaxID=1437817 RepID=UPI000CC31E7E|nr:DUF1194 domain-containing protein [Methylopila sp. Yamaguchi]GBD50720.1 hypothetical protein METY_3933 [Methylopila sp. Yamaguchi]